MARSPRLVEPGAFHHVSPRGNNQRVIFTDAVDRGHHLTLLTQVVRRYGWVVFGYCQMTNHFHVVLQDPAGTLSRGMQFLQAGYARFWNQRHRCADHLFRNRFESRSVRTDRHLVATVAYIDLNPVRARISERPEQWPWSSCRAHLGLAHPAPFLAQNDFDELLAATPALARRAYRQLLQSATQR
jgi:putative transposase